MSEKPYVMYGSLMSFYSGKVRCYLRKKHLNFEERLPNHPHFLNTLVPKVGGAYQPTIEAPDGSIVQDTTEIIDYLEARHPEFSVYPSGPKQKLIALIFEHFGDEGMLKAAMHYRWCDPEDNTKWIIPPSDKSDWIARWFMLFADPDLDESIEEQAQKRMTRVCKVILPALGINEKTVPAIEGSYEDFLRLFDKHLQQYPYLLGGKPSIGDFGLIGSLYGHLGRDPYSSSFMKKNAPFVYDWVERMNAPESGLSMYPEVPADFLPGDKIPETLLPILSLIADDFMPEVRSIIEFLGNMLEEKGDVPPGTPVSNHRILALGAANPIGQHTVSMRGVEVTQMVRYYSQWMFQRVLDQYQSLTETDKSDLEAILQSTGLLPYLNIEIARRINRENFVEVFE